MERTEHDHVTATERERCAKIADEYAIEQALASQEEHKHHVSKKFWQEALLTIEGKRIAALELAAKIRGSDK